MKKYLLLIFLILVFTLSISVTVFAEEIPETENAYTENTAPVEMPDNAEEQNTFSEIYELILNNSDKLFSLLAFISSLVMVFAYKKGLIPIINTGLSAIRKSTDTFEKSAGESLIKAEESLNFLTSKFASCINTLEDISDCVDKLSERLDAIEEDKDSAKTFKTVMLSQIDMLYEIFMKSGLPQYSKDALGEKVAQMKKSITSGEENV